MTQTTLTELNLKMNVESDAVLRNQMTGTHDQSWERRDCWAILTACPAVLPTRMESDKGRFHSLD